MEREPVAPESGEIDRGSACGLFSELLASAMHELGAQPSPMAVSYLGELLQARLRVPTEPEGDGPTLAEALLRARLEAGAVRLRQLRDLGDRALFESGLFGDRLSRSLVDLDYTASIGRSAYRDVSVCLRGNAGGPSWPRLFRELADDFSCFVDVLAEVGDRTRAVRETDLLRAYDRFVATGSPRDRRRLMRSGLVPPPGGQLGRWQ